MSDALLESSTLPPQFTGSIYDGRQQQKVFLQGLFEGHIHARSLQYVQYQTLRDH